MTFIKAMRSTCVVDFLIAFLVGACLMFCYLC